MLLLTISRIWSTTANRSWWFFMVMLTGKSSSPNYSSLAYCFWAVPCLISRCHRWNCYWRIPCLMRGKVLSATQTSKIGSSGGTGAVKASPLALLEVFLTPLHLYIEVQTRRSIFRLSGSISMVESCLYRRKIEILFRGCLCQGMAWKLSFISIRNSKHNWVSAAMTYAFNQQLIRRCTNGVFKTEREQAPGPLFQRKHTLNQWVNIVGGNIRPR